MGAHAGYVIASYGVAAFTVAALVAWVLIDGRGRRKDLQRLEQSGIRRRSAQAGDRSGDTA